MNARPQVDESPAQAGGILDHPVHFHAHIDNKHRPQRTATRGCQVFSSGPGGFVRLAGQQLVVDEGLQSIGQH